MKSTISIKEIKQAIAEKFECDTESIKFNIEVNKQAYYDTYKHIADFETLAAEIEHVL